jgi:hypothetical protein
MLLNEEELKACANEGRDCGVWCVAILGTAKKRDNETEH